MFGKEMFHIENACLQQSSDLADAMSRGKRGFYSVAIEPCYYNWVCYIKASYRPKHQIRAERVGSRGGYQFK